jgi:hypothetical protein
MTQFSAMPGGGAQGEGIRKRQGPASSLLCMDVYDSMVYDWLPWQAAMTALIPGGASATTVRSQPLHYIYPCVKTTSRCKGEERP